MPAVLLDGVLTGVRAGAAAAGVLAGAMAAVPAVLHAVLWAGMPGVQQAVWVHLLLAAVALQVSVLKAWPKGLAACVGAARP